MTDFPCPGTESGERWGDVDELSPNPSLVKEVRSKFLFSPLYYCKTIISLSTSNSERPIVPFFDVSLSFYFFIPNTPLHFSQYIKTL